MTTAEDPLFRIFRLACGVPPEQRAALLDVECAGDLNLRHELELLLVSDAAESSTSLLEGIAHVPRHVFSAALAAAGREDPPGTPPVQTIGPFVIVGKIREGGFGTVYRAIEKPLGRTVALKVLSEPRQAVRFAREVQDLARLGHPHIAKVFASGTTPGGLPFFSMELVARADGKAARWITRHANLYRLTVRERLQLFLPVCSAVHYAHQEGLVHRDLKPANILVREGGDFGHPMIIDFGIARRVSNPQATLTNKQEIMGTPPYMSPEQTETSVVDPRSDVYSLGMVLFELLTGCLPFSGWRQKSIGDKLAVMKNQEARQASSAALRAGDRVAKRCKCKPRQLVSFLRGDLDIILARALDKDPSRRFSTPDEMAKDLVNHLEGRRIHSRRQTVVLSLRKFAHRHRTFTTGVAAIVTVLVLAVVGGSFVIAEKAAALAKSMRLETLANLRSAELALTSEDGGALARSLDGIPLPLRGWEWRYLDGMRSNIRSVVNGPGGIVSALAVDARGDRLIVGTRSGITQVFQTTPLGPRGQVIETPSNPTGKDIWVAAWSPDCRHFATGSFDHTLRTYRADGTLVWERSRHGEVAYRTIYAVAWSPDGRHVAVGGGYAMKPRTAFVGLCNAVDGEPTFVDTSRHSAPVCCVAFSPDGRWFASSADDCKVCLWRVDGFTLALESERVLDSAVNTIAFSPDSGLLAAGTLAHAIHLLEVPSLRARTILAGHMDAVADITFDPQGTTIASASWDSTIRIWSVATAAVLQVLRGHRSRVNRVVYSSDGRLFSGSDDETVMEWDPTMHGRCREAKVGKEWIRDLLVLADDRIVVRTEAGDVLLLDPATLDTHNVGKGNEIDVSATGHTMVMSGSGIVQVFRDGELRSRLSVPASMDWRGGLSLLDDDSALFFSKPTLTGLDLTADRWNEVPIANPVGIDDTLFAVSRLGPGADIVTLWYNGTTQVSSRREGRTALSGHPIHLCRRERLLAVLLDGPSRTMQVLDVEQRRVVATLRGHREQIVDVDFSHDGHRLASVADDGTLRIWDWRNDANDALLLTIKHPAKANSQEGAAAFSSVAWSRDGSTLVTGSTDGMIHLWSTRR